MQRTFRTKISKTVLALALTGTAIFLASAVLNFLGLLRWKDLSDFNRVARLVVLILSLILCAFLVLFLTLSKYYVKQGKLVWWAVFPFTLSLSAVTDAVYFDKSKSLILFYTERGAECRMLVLIRPEEVNGFVDLLKENGAPLHYAIDYEEEPKK